MLNPVQDGLNLELNSWSPGRGFVVFEQRQTTWIMADQLFVFGGVVPGSKVPLGWSPEARLLAQSSEAAVPDGGRAAAGRSAAHLRSRPAACDWGPIGGCRRTRPRNSRITPLLPTNSATEPDFTTLTRRLGASSGGRIKCPTPSSLTGRQPP
jgi:hypothetical protein